MIRPATADDLPLVRELSAEFEREVPDELWGHDDSDTEHDVVLLADDVGIAALDRKSERAWLLDLLYVRPSARGRGLGRELLRAAAEHVQEQGAEMLALEVLESNKGARRLYDRLGFRTVERVLAAPVGGLVAAEQEGPTFGAVHVQTDDSEKVRRDAAKVLRLEPDIQVGSGWVRVSSEATDADPAASSSHWASSAAPSCATTSSTEAPTSTSTCQFPSTTGRCPRATPTRSGRTQPSSHG